MISYHNSHNIISLVIPSLILCVHVIMYARMLVRVREKNHIWMGKQWWCYLVRGWWEMTWMWMWHVTWCHDGAGSHPASTHCKCRYTVHYIHIYTQVLHLSWIFYSHKKNDMLLIIGWWLRKNRYVYVYVRMLWTMCGSRHDMVWYGMMAHICSFLGMANSYNHININTTCKWIDGYYI